ncbi:MAG: hypothetical protein PF483_08040, partial [Halothiobacillus sp.]|nr:hypothetical protein [Halothiobacillus sp.]
MNHSKSGLQQPRAQRALSAMLFALLALAPVFSAHAAVSIDQSPLFIQIPFAPNIVLMLDDSGSMGWDFMPDINYINNNNNNDALIDASNNYVYYDPKRTYTPPIKADGTSYPNATGLTSAWLNGFNTAQGSVDLTNYNGNQDTGWVNYSAPGPTKTTTYNNVSYNQCVDYYNSTPNVTGGNYNSKKDICTIYSTDGGAFQYSVGPAAGPYVVHYVANTNCGSLTNCLLASDTSGTSAPAGIAAGQNIANWFAYSHTRILMAKTGLMGAFYALDPKFRLGFGSINGRNTGGLPSPTFAFATSTNSSNALAEVAPFGNGAAGTQKADFWSWLVGEQPGNSTPLRGALDAVGKYYQSAQPWQTSNTDTNAYACRQSYAILTTDGFWNGGTPSNIGNQDGTAGNTNLGSKAYTVAPPYEDSRSDTLADVAMKYWKTDLRTGLANEVPTSLNDPANWQHMVTFTVGLGFDPTGITPATITVPGKIGLVSKSGTLTYQMLFELRDRGFTTAVGIG